MADSSPTWAWCRSIAISGTTPEPPADQQDRAAVTGCQTKYPPTGPRTSTRSPASGTHREVRRDLAIHDPLDGQLDAVSSGADAIE